jgi:nucleoid DNA-binding protein
MTRADLVSELVENHQLTHRDAKQVVSVVFGSITQALKDGEDVDLPIGRFEVAVRKRKPLRGWFLNRIRVTYKKQKYIRFTPGEV